MFFNDVFSESAAVEAKETGLTPDYAGAYRLVAESTEEWYNLREKMMRLEHTAIIREDAALLTEGSGQFFKKVADFFRKMWSKIKEIWQKFTVWVSNQVMSDKEFIRKYEKVIRNKTLTGFEVKARHWISGPLGAQTNIQGALDIASGLWGDADKVMSKMDKADAEKEAKALKTRLEGDAWANGVRKAISGSSVDEGEFDETIRKKFFVGGDTDVQDIEAAKLDVTAMMDAVKDANKTIGDAEKDRKAVEKLLENAAKFFDGVAKKVEGVNLDDKNGNYSTENIDRHEGEARGYSVRANTGTDGGAGAGATAQRDLINYGGARKAGGSNEPSGIRHSHRDAANLAATATRKIATVASSAFGTLIQGLRDRRGEYRSILAKIITYTAKNESARLASGSGSSVLDLF